MKTFSLLNAIKTILSTEIPKNAQVIGSKIRDEDGVGTASSAIKRYFQIEASS